ncbi:MAG: hypothetical protein WC565_03450 [Parcubacteria group bacterium]|jgi:hypothetical protein
MASVKIDQTPPTLEAKRQAKDIVRPVIVDICRRFLKDSEATRSTLNDMLKAAYPLVELHPLLARHALRCRLKVTKARPAKWSLICEVQHANVKGPCYVSATFSWGPYKTAYVKEPRFPPAPSSTGTAPMYQALVDWNCAYASEWRHRRDCVTLMNDGFRRIDRGRRLSGELLDCLYDMGWNGMERSYDD